MLGRPVAVVVAAVGDVSSDVVGQLKSGDEGCTQG